MISTQQSNKDVLAKLMATENITVIHKSVPTAYFDVKSRTLVCPILKGEMSPELTDLFMGHEVGHALNTPSEGWHDKVSDKGMVFKGYLNVIEDCRIEKMIKSKYPGLRKSFYAGYKDLAKRDFFGLKDRDLTKLNLIDRINIHFKIGSIARVQFSEEELPYILRCEKLQTWDEVVILSEELFDRQNQLNEEELDAMSDLDIQDMMEELGLDDESGETMSVEISESDEEDENEQEGSDAKSEDTSDTENSDDETNSTDASEGTETENDEKNSEGSKGLLLDEMNKSISDEAFREKESSLYNKDDYGYNEPTYFEIKDKIKYENFIVDYKKIDNIMSGTYHGQSFDRTKISPQVKEFQDTNKKIINYMVKEFEMKKAAAAYNRSWSAKSGELDMNKLHLFKLKDDIFNRVQVTPEGKNHGLVMLLDWSGSMHGTVKSTIEQATLLSMFCRRLSVPFRLYAFSDGYVREEVKEIEEKFPSDDDWREKSEAYDNHYRKLMYGKSIQNNENEEDWSLGNVKLLEIYNEKQSNSEFTKAMENWFQLAESIENNWYYYDEDSNHDSNFPCPHGLNLSGTPLDHSLVIVRDLIQDFQLQNNLDITSLITLTDGSSHNVFSNGYGRTKHLVDRRYNTTTKFKNGRDTHSLLKWIKDTTNCNTIGFYITTSKGSQIVSDAERFCATKCDYFGDEYDTKRKEFNNLATTFDDGCYDLAIMINQKKMKLNYNEDELNVEEGANKGVLKRALVKAGNSKMKQRVILNKFVSQMAV